MCLVATVEIWGQWFRDIIGVGPDRNVLRGADDRRLGQDGSLVHRPQDAKGKPSKDAFQMVLDRAGVVRWLQHGSFDGAQAQELKLL